MIEDLKYIIRYYSKDPDLVYTQYSHGVVYFGGNDLGNLNIDNPNSLLTNMTKAFLFFSEGRWHYSNYTKTKTW